MRKGFMGIISLVLVFCLVLAGCGSAQAKDSGSQEAAESSAETAEQDTPEVASEQDTPEVALPPPSCAIPSSKAGSRMAISGVFSSSKS